MEDARRDLRAEARPDAHQSPTGQRARRLATGGRGCPPDAYEEGSAWSGWVIFAAIVMFTIEQMPQKDVAEALKCSVEAVKWHVFQGRKKLKELLKDHI